MKNQLYERGFKQCFKYNDVPLLHRRKENIKDKKTIIYKTFIRHKTYLKLLWCLPAVLVFLGKINQACFH